MVLVNNNLGANNKSDVKFMVSTSLQLLEFLLDDDPRKNDDYHIIIYMKLYKDMLRNNSSKDQKGCEEAKEEGIIRSNNNNNSDGKYSFPKASTSSRQWSGFRNPRIVRVSRSFGGKDRHSKVCTIRGLRDRRIRLSVPTAIQLYDLQDKLKLGQPSKVIDWLLDVTKLDIDNLPPLQFPPGFSPFHQQMLFGPQYVDPHHHSSSSSSRFCNSVLPPPFGLDVKGVDAYQTTMTTTVEKTKLWDVDLGLQEKAGSTTAATTKGKWINDGSNNSNSQQVEDYNNEQISSQKLLSMAICSSNLPNMMNNNSTPYNNYNSSQFGNNNNNNNGAFPSQLVEASQTSTSSSSTSSLFFTPYASYITNNPIENHIHFLSSNSHALSNPFIPNSSLHPFAPQNLKPFQAPSFNLKQLLHPTENNAGGGNGAGAGSFAKDGAAGNS